MKCGLPSLDAPGRQVHLLGWSGLRKPWPASLSPGGIGAGGGKVEGSSSSKEEEEEEEEEDVKILSNNLRRMETTRRRPWSISHFTGKFVAHLFGRVARSIKRGKKGQTVSQTMSQKNCRNAQFQVLIKKKFF